MKTFAFAAIAAVAAAQYSYDIDSMDMGASTTTTTTSASSASNVSQHTASANASVQYYHQDTYVVDYNPDLAAIVAEQMEIEFMAQMARLPDMCETGKACHEKIWAEARIRMEQNWVTAYATVKKTLENTYMINKAILVEEHTAFYDCKPGCMCDNIEIEYLDVIRMETEITEQIELLTTDLVYLEEKMHGVEITCPDYTLIHYDESTYTSTVVGSDSSTVEVGREIISEEAQDGYVVHSDTTTNEWQHEMQAGDEDFAASTLHEEIISGGETEFAHDSVEILDPTTVVLEEETVTIN